MNTKYEPLFTPWKIGNVEIKNRIVMTSMGGTSLFGWMEPNHFDQEASKFILERAKNNVGLLLPGIAPIKDMILGKWLYKGDGKFKKLKEFMTELHKTGAKLFVQLTAGFGRSLALTHILVSASRNKLLGGLMKPFINVDYMTASASATPNRWDESIISRPMKIKEIKAIIDGFAKVSRKLQLAGVDGVEVHAVHEGYLLDQFTMKYTNSRTDEYGGSFENRYRFPVEIVQAIKSACGKDFPVSLRYSVVSKTKGFCEGALPGEEYIEAGRDLEEGMRAGKYLQDAGYDMLNCDNGTYDAWYWAHPPQYMPNNCNLHEAKELKKVVSIPVVCAGKMDPQAASDAIANNEIDGMGVARPFLADAEWVTKMIQDREDDIRPCIHCHNACFNMAHYKGVANDQSLSDNAGMSRCAINPLTMQSKKYKIIPTTKPKKVAIVGGGIGGMETARLLAQRGHKPTIFEKTDRLGGVFIAAAAPDFKHSDKALIKWFTKQMADLNIEIKYNTNITNISELQGYDKIVVASGSKPKRIPIEGASKAIDAVDYLLGNTEVGNRVVIIGGGLSGCEIAYDLYIQGKKPIIIEAKNDLIAVKGVCLANSSYLRDFFALNNVEVHLESTVDSIGDTSVAIRGKDGTTTDISCDNVIMSVGYNSAPTFARSSKVELVGDCDTVGNLRTVIWRAWDVAMSI